MLSHSAKVSLAQRKWHVVHVDAVQLAKHVLFPNQSDAAANVLALAAVQNQVCLQQE